MTTTTKPPRHGLTLVFTGNGKGKTTAAVVTKALRLAKDYPGSNGLIAFIRQTSDCQDIYLLRADASTAKLTKCPQAIGTPAWSPNAKLLAVSYVTPSDNSFSRSSVIRSEGTATRANPPAY